MGDMGDMEDNTFRGFLERKEQEIGNLTDITHFVKHQYPAINVLGKSHSELADWMKKQGLVPAHGITTDRFHAQMKELFKGFR